MGTKTAAEMSSIKFLEFCKSGTSHSKRWRTFQSVKPPNVCNNFQPIPVPLLLEHNTWTKQKVVFIYLLFRSFFKPVSIISFHIIVPRMVKTKIPLDSAISQHALSCTCLPILWLVMFFVLFITSNNNTHQNLNLCKQKKNL